MTAVDPGHILMQRLDALGQISDEPGRLTRTFCSPAMRRANDLVGSWMREAGMTVRQDAIGNLIGHYPGEQPDRKIFLLGSHLDTVRDAGKFDGPLGVLTAIACVHQLSVRNIRLPFALEVIGFADEEGVRYQAAYLGSQTVAGSFNPDLLKRIDAQGLTMAEAIRHFGGDPGALDGARLDPARLLGYAEVHIEQGPVLEEKQLAAGVVNAIAGQSRLELSFTGAAGHAGTVPMSSRRDALCAAAEFILAVESVGRSVEGLVCTVGEITALPGASNVIPGQVRLSLDVRHGRDTLRLEVVDKLKERAEQIATVRHVRWRWQLVQETAAVACAEKLCTLLGQALKRHQSEVISLPSGAGHDAAVMAAITPVAMLFVRCKGGLSHHPGEFASLEDARLAIDVVSDFLQLLARQQ